MDRQAVKPYYEDESVTLYHGKWEDVLPRIDLSGVSLTLTDPPYNVGLDYSNGDNRDDYPNGLGSGSTSAHSRSSSRLDTADLAMWLAMEKPRWICAWVRPNQNSASALNGWNTWELRCSCTASTASQSVRTRWVAPIASPPDAAGHPCPKHLPLLDELLDAFARPTATVLDPFTGSGTTLSPLRTRGGRPSAWRWTRRSAN